MKLLLQSSKKSVIYPLLLLISCYSFQSVTAQECDWKACNLAYKRCLKKGNNKFCKANVLNAACGVAGEKDDCVNVKKKKCQELSTYGTDCELLETVKKQRGCLMIKENFGCDQTVDTDDVNTDDGDNVECTEDCPHEGEKISGIKQDASKDVDEESMYIYTDIISPEEYELLLKAQDLGTWEYDESLKSYVLKRKLTSARLSAEKRGGLEMLDAVKTFPLDKDSIGSITGKITEGNWASHLNLRAEAEFIQEILQDKDLGEGEDLAANVYGADDRYVYRDTSYPWSTVGRVSTTGGGSCSGTMVGRNLMLTAGHCMQWNADGTVGAFSFTPSYYNGDAPFGTAWATRVYYWMKAEGPGITDLESAYDYVVAVLNTDIGRLTGYAGYRVYSDSWNGGNYWQNTGYPSPLTGTQRPSFSGGGSIDTEQPQTLAGAPDASVLGTRIDTERGQSGGNAWGWWDGESFPRIVGVCSASARTPTSTGTRGDNDFGGGQALWDLISYARDVVPGST